MNKKSLLEMVKGRWREFLREPSALFFVIFMPLVWMVILGLAFSNPKPEHYKIGLLTSQRPSLLSAPGGSSGSGEQAWAQKVESSLAASAQLSLARGSQEELQLQLKRGEIQVICLPDASRELVRFAFDPTNPEAARAKIFADDVLQRAFGRRDPVASISEHISAVGSRYIDFLIPGLLALSLLTSSLFGTGMTIVANRRENLLKRYCATPMNPYAYILSHIIGRYLIFAVEFATIMLGGLLLFGFKVQGSWLTLILVALLATASFTALGILCGARTPSTATYNGLNNLLTLPMMILSGVWFSRSNFPGWLDPLIDFLPLTACVDALRKIALEGAGLHQLGFELSVLAAYTVVCTVLAKLSFRWY